MLRPTRALTAIALTVALGGGASVASAASVPPPGTLDSAAGHARATASAALAGLRIPATSGMRAEAVGAAQTVHEVLSVVAAGKRYDIHVDSVGRAADTTSIHLFAAGRPVDVTVRKYLRISLRRHGHHHGALEVTTTFRRFLAIELSLVADPLRTAQKRFVTRADLVAALAQTLALTGPEVTHRFRSILRFAQMNLDVAATLLSAGAAIALDPTITDLSSIPTTHTTAGDGRYSGEVVLTGGPSAPTVQSVNDTDHSALTETIGDAGVTVSYTVDGSTWTRSAGS